MLVWWRGRDPAIRAAVVAGVFGVFAGLVTGIASRPAAPPATPSPTATRNPEQNDDGPGKTDPFGLAPIRLSLDWTGFDDGEAHAYETGCPNGQMFAVSNAGLLTAPYLNPRSIPPGVVMLGPMNAFVALDSQILAGEYG